ncbi:MAG TPA: hemolysin III family protein [Pedococcus sp.]|nr:hemolysin III family protein [Pedococcus sp.]
MSPTGPSTPEHLPGRPRDRVHDKVSGAAHSVKARGAEAADAVHEHIESALQEVKPKLRGWLHAVTSPLTLAAGVVLIVLSPTAATRVGSSVFMASALLLFTVSAIYHRGTWSPRAWAFLRRFDHANIFLLIAGSYTPFALLMLDGSDRVSLLAVAWGGALAGVLFRVLWPGAPRWLYVPIYIGLGWAAIFYVDEFAGAASVAVLTLIVVGGLLYSLGGVVYGLQRPDPSPSWFGFHEVFHTLTIAAFVTHYVGVSLATYSLR